MKKPRILIVDNEKTFTDTFSEFLSERFNADILVRKNAMEGIEVLDQQEVDVLFQDMNVPGLGAEHVIHHLKNRKRIEEMIVFIISRWNDDRKTLKFENYGLNYIPKPISLIITQKVLTEEFETSGSFDYKKS